MHTATHPVVLDLLGDAQSNTQAGSYLTYAVAFVIMAVSCLWSWYISKFVKKQMHSKGEHFQGPSRTKLHSNDN